MKEPYQYDLDDACQSVAKAPRGSQFNPLLIRVHVAGSMSVDPFSVHFSGDPRELGFEVVGLYASAFADAALERGRALSAARERETTIEQELAAIRRELEQERQIVARFERLTGILADQIAKDDSWE